MDELEFNLPIGKDDIEYSLPDCDMPDFEDENYLPPFDGDYPPFEDWDGISQYDGRPI